MAGGPIQKYQGSCHCGAVSFEINTNLDKVVQCNCSICTRKGALHHRVPPEQFTLLSGEEDLQIYKFGTRKASHYFCKHCGIHPFSRPRAAPDLYSVNIRCLHNFDLEQCKAEVIYFDGKHWEQAIKNLK